jgi:hypothetical protein
MALSVVTLSEIPTLAAEVETEARSLSAQVEVTPDFVQSLEDFSSDAMRLSDSLRQAGVTQDMPCIFRGISEDARERVTALQAADTAPERQMAMNELKALLDDAILLAPMAAGAAADAAVTQVATR